MKRKGSQNAQHVICAKVKCGERERERVDEELKRTYCLWTKYGGVNLKVGALSLGVGLAIWFWSLAETVSRIVFMGW